MNEQPLLSWLRAAIRAASSAGLDNQVLDESLLDEDLLDQDAIEALLDLAREAAHGVERPAAPLATFAAGLVLGQRRRPLGDTGSEGRRVAIEELRSVAAAIAEAANHWDAPPLSGGAQPSSPDPARLESDFNLPPRAPGTLS